jgi:hypothetical protein
MLDLLQRARELEIQAQNDNYLLGKNKAKLRGENLLDKGKRLEKIDEAQKKRFLFVLDKERQVLEMKAKENRNMFQKSMEEGVEFMKLGKKKKHKPVEVIDVEKLEEDGEIPKYEKIIHYAEKYRVPFMKSGIRKNYQELEKEIQSFEKKFLKQLLGNGKDKKYGEYGLFIKSK